MTCRTLARRPPTRQALLRKDDPGLDQRDLPGPHGADLPERDDLAGRPEQRDPVAVAGLDVADRNRLALADFPDLQRGERDPRERERHVLEGDGMRRGDPLLRRHRLEAVEGNGVLDAEGPDGRSPERVQVRAAPEAVAQLAGDRANIGSRRAGDRKGDEAFAGFPEGELRDDDSLGELRNALSAA